MLRGGSRAIRHAVLCTQFSARDVRSAAAAKPSLLARAFPLTVNVAYPLLRQAASYLMIALRVTVGRNAVAECAIALRFDAAAMELGAHRLDRAQIRAYDVARVPAHHALTSLEALMLRRRLWHDCSAERAAGSPAASARGRSGEGRETRASPRPRRDGPLHVKKSKLEEST